MSQLEFFYPETSDPSYSCWSLLPTPEPRTVAPPPDEFYQTVAKHLIKDTVRIMSNGLPIDLDRVIQLEQELDSILLDVEQRIASNPHIQAYLEQAHAAQIAAYISEQQSKLKQPSDFVKPFKHTDMTHRSYFMHIFATENNLPLPDEFQAPGITKWPAKLVSKLAKFRPILARFLAGELPESNPYIKQAIERIATDKCEIYNKSYLDKIHTPAVEYPKFNPNSAPQKQALFEMLNIQSEAVSPKTGLPKWDRDQIERVNRESEDPDVIALTQALIDHSFAAIVRNNFIEAFYKYTVNGRLYGQYKLLGAKSGRYTSSNPNMLNSPSTGSIFSKPIKRCFTAPPGFVIAAIDYSALEDRVMASLSRDVNKCGLFLDHLDGHSLSATYYYPGRVAEIIGPFSDNREASKLLKAKVDEGDKAAKAVRQDSKPISFGLAYGAFPKKVAATVKIPLSEAEGIFNAYHNEMYPGITEYRENYVLPTTKEHGKVHLGMGFYLHSDDPDRDIRTLNNATCQFWSILTALAINKMHQLIDDHGLQDDIQVTSTIYDSIYFIVRDDARYIQWLNDTLVPIMVTDFMQDQTIPNEANLEIGLDWADLHELPNNASLDQIQEVLNVLRNPL